MSLFFVSDVRSSVVSGAVSALALATLTACGGGMNRRSNRWN